MVSSSEPTESSQAMVNSADEAHKHPIIANAAAVIAGKPIRYLHKRKGGVNDNMQTDNDTYTRVTGAELNESTKAKELVANVGVSSPL